MSEIKVSKELFQKLLVLHKLGFQSRRQKNLGKV